MRTPRRAILIKNKTQYFHVVSRVVDRRYIFKEDEKRAFLRIARQMEAFSGIEILSYTLMSNHFHLLIKVPPSPQDMDNDEVWRRIQHLYNQARIEELKSELENLQAGDDDSGVQEFFQRFRDRMFNLSEFVRGVKQRFSVWYNLHNDRKGTLWEERFKSVLMQDNPHTLMTVAAYIELNALRAGIVNDPGEYVWCSYGEAMAGGKKARAGIIQLTSEPGQNQSWQKAWMAYQLLISGKPLGKASKKGHIKPITDGAENKNNDKPGDSPSLSQFLKLRKRYFTEALVMGNQQFIESFYKDKIQWLCPTRKIIAHFNKELSNLVNYNFYTYRNLKNK